MNMRKQIETVIILFIIVFSTFGLGSIRLFPIVKATYVEGDIKQDTIWTLLESPFVISKSITIYADATLTIEPGVEVRFGEELSITVNGQIYANGTNKQILFTSNKKTPVIGDWKAIVVNGTGKVTIVGCSVKYAENGILVENGETQVKNSEIKFCQNGINITDGIVAIQDSVITENTKNGIIVA